MENVTGVGLDRSFPSQAGDAGSMFAGLPREMEAGP